MADPALVTATWGLVAVSGGLVAITGWFLRAQILAQRNAEQVRLAVIRRDRYESEEMQRYRRALAHQLRSIPGKPLPHFDPAVPNFFDVTGLLLRNGYVAKDLIDGFFGYGAKHYWQALKATLENDRTCHPTHDLWSGFSYLFDQLGGKSPTEGEMRGFLAEEINLQPYGPKIETLSAMQDRAT